MLRPEFSDLTDSKIRFLEDRKLISPARTQGGYRSFGPHDIEVLRWILTRQRDQYLPLSIIGERIDRGEHLADIWGIGVTEPARPPVAGTAVPVNRGEDDANTATAAEEAIGGDAVHHENADGEAAGGEAADDGHDAPADRVEATLTSISTAPPWGAPDSPRTYNAAELSAETGLTLDEIAELTDFGLLVPLGDADTAGFPRSRPPATDISPSGDGTPPIRPPPVASDAAETEAVQVSLGLEPPEPRYGSSALLIARISREFATYGLHARHLRVIRNAAARDASMFEQGIQPILHAGGPSADLDAQRSLGRLVALCERLRSAVMGEALHRYWR